MLIFAIRWHRCASNIFLLLIQRILLMNAIATIPDATLFSIDSKRSSTGWHDQSSVGFSVVATTTNLFSIDRKCHRQADTTSRPLDCSVVSATTNLFSIDRPGCVKSETTTNIFSSNMRRSSSGWHDQSFVGLQRAVSAISNLFTFDRRWSSASWLDQWATACNVQSQKQRICSASTGSGLRYADTISLSLACSVDSTTTNRFSIDRKRSATGWHDQSSVCLQRAVLTN